MSLTAVQGQVLCALFRLASDEGASLTDCEDLQAVVSFAAAHAERLVPRYGHMSPQTLAVIQRAVLHLETQGAGSLLGAPALDVGDFVTQDSKGHGIVNIIDCVELSQAPFAYAALMLCLMRELRERLPEVGDAPTPRLAFFVDEAHTLFKDAPAALLSDVERTVRLIRSKGVGIYFVTQSPSDIPGPILAQLGNRIYHGMRSFTVDDQKALRAAAAGLRQNPLLDATSTLGELRRGEALISLLDKDGAPSIVERAEVLPPRCRLEVAAYPAGPPVIHNKDIGMDKNTHDLDDITAAKHALAAAKPPVAKAGSQSVKGQGIKEKPRPSLFHDLQDIAQAVQRISAASPLEDLLLPAARNAADALLDGAFRRAEQLAHARKRSEKSRQARQHPAKNNKPKRKRRT
jgi:hypothetical protein